MYEHIIAEVYGQPWAIIPEKLAQIHQFLTRRLAGTMSSEAEIQAAINAALPRGPKRATGATAVVPVYGTITQKAGLMQMFSGGTSLESVRAQFRAALADPGVTAIVLDINSPGGVVYGVPELAAEIMAARGTKPIVACTESMAGSAAYWLAAACDDIAAAPSALVGSIGAIMMHQDVSAAAEAEGIKTTIIAYGENKANGNQWQPLSDAARTELEAQVTHYGQMFEAGVGKGRGVSAAQVHASFGQGKMFTPRDAVALGMIDRVATLDQTLARFGATLPAQSMDVRGGPIDEEEGDEVRADSIDGEDDGDDARRRAKARMLLKRMVLAGDLTNAR